MENGIVFLMGIITGVVFCLVSATAIYYGNQELKSKKKPTPKDIKLNIKIARTNGSPAQVRVNVSGYNVLDIANLHTATVPGHMWVKVMNPDGIRNQNCTFEFGETGSLQRGGKLRKIKSLDNMVLALYEAPYIAAGAQCPTGTLCLIDENDFLHFTKQYNQIEQEEKERKALIESAFNSVEV